MEKTDPRVTDLSGLLKNVRDPDTAPVIYFDNVPLRAGEAVFNIALSTVRMSIVDGATQVEQVVVAHLRCNREAAASLKAALDFLLTAEPTPQEGKAN